MKKLLALMTLIFIGTVGSRVGESLSSDAVSMAVGLLLGVMAGIPTALLVLASDRRQRAYDENYPQRPQTKALPAPYAQQPPVIVLTGQAQTLPDGYVQTGSNSAVWAGEGAGPCGQAAQHQNPVNQTYQMELPQRRPVQQEYYDQPPQQWSVQQPGNANQAPQRRLPQRQPRRRQEMIIIGSQDEW